MLIQPEYYIKSIHVWNNHIASSTKKPLQLLIIINQTQARYVNNIPKQ